MNKQTIYIWGRKFELDVILECYPGETVLESQKQAFEQLCAAGVINSALEPLKDYVAANAGAQVTLPIENIFKYVMPKRIFVPHSKKAALVAIMCNFKFDMEHGIAVVFENGQLKKIGPQDIIL